MKTCSHCNESKNEGEFYIRTQYEGGTDYYCKSCRLDTTAASRKRRARQGPPCTNCGDKYVYYAKGLCHTCYAYRCRTGVDRPMDNDYTKTLLDWAFRVMRGEEVEDIAKTSEYCSGTIQRVLNGKIDGRQWRRAYNLLPKEMRKEVRYSITSLLRPRDVRKIRELAANGHTQEEIGKIYNRTYSAISRIVNGSRYGHVT